MVAGLFLPPNQNNMANQYNFRKLPVNIFRSSFNKLKQLANKLKYILVPTFGVVITYIVLSFFVTLGLAILGISAIALFIPLAFRGWSREYSENRQAR